VSATNSPPGWVSPHCHSDLDLIVRLPEPADDLLDQLIALRDKCFGEATAPVDCRVDTPVGAISLAELVAGFDLALVNPPAYDFLPEVGLMNSI
jgi:hypothetical protein